MLGRHIEYEDPPRRPRPDTPGTEERMHHLAMPHGTMVRADMPSCEYCSESKVCLRRVIALQTFARPECEAAVAASPVRRGSRPRSARRQRILDLLAERPRTVSEIVDLLGSTESNIRWMMAKMHHDNLVVRVGRSQKHGSEYYNVLWSIPGQSAAATNC